MKLLLCTATLIAGGAIYARFRPETLLGSICGACNDMHVPDFVAYNLPGGLWALAYILIIDCIENDITTKLRIASIIPLIGIVTELLQVAELCPGTFDNLDILCYLIPYLIYFVIIKTKTICFLKTIKRQLFTPLS